MQPAAPGFLAERAMGTLHRQATGRASLRLPPDHAQPDFFLVGNEIGAKPHRIGRASIAGVLVDLCDHSIGAA